LISLFYLSLLVKLKKNLEIILSFFMHENNIWKI
jgi:hypothetical protein